ncbi:hypothetical protein J1N10_09095 [Carboxylicivirga sp. A043]|uniref:RyR domain-containing protein n=1 Tax=Carboxylicivirga litoralis TaxID=2816963 RepID=UPI0021CAEA9D|nr:RyR domain-containing protein [Carboxylicivirga sp. A043]MCU4156134.1 hypothetical protein [Carboxylicivirga sp. A043]
MNKLPRQLIEKLAEQVHIRWMEKRKAEGWSYGPERNDERKQTPCMVPYDELSELEKDYDRSTARQTLESIIELGYNVVKR